MGASFTMEPLLVPLFIVGLMWALLIRPHQRRLRQHQAVVNSLRPGDEIITAGGVYGRVRSVDERSMTVEVAPGVELRLVRQAVSERIAREDDDDEDTEARVQLDKDYGSRANGEAIVTEPSHEEEQ